MRWLAWLGFPQPPTDYVEDLKRDAEAIATYGRWTGRAGHDALLSTLAEVRGLGATPSIGASQVIRLSGLAGEGFRTIPFETLVAIRKGWTPHRSTLWSTVKLYAFVVLSLYVVWVTGSLTVVYNDGIGIVRDLEALASTDTRKTFGRLIRDVDQAEREAGMVLPIDAPDPQTRAAQFDLARNVYFNGEAELMDLSGRLAQAQQSSDTFTKSLSQAVPLLSPIRCRMYTWRNGTLAEGIEEITKQSRERLEIPANTPSRTSDLDSRGQSEKGILEAEFLSACPDGGGKAAARTDPTVDAEHAAGLNAGSNVYPEGLPDPSGDYSRLAVLNRCLSRSATGSPPSLAATLVSSDEIAPVRDAAAPARDASEPTEASTGGPAGTPTEASDISTFGQYRSELDMLVESLRCRNVISFAPEGYPQIANEIVEMHKVLTPLAVLALPALYGAAGALLSLLRPAIHPLHPNPPLPKIIFRVSFGALAGVVLVWFLAPGSAIAGQMTAFGLSLFGLAFVVGFSLDLFFGFFDRLVALTNASVGQIGREPRPASLAAPAASMQGGGPGAG